MILLFLGILLLFVQTCIFLVLSKDHVLSIVRVLVSFFSRDLI
jgi:hypothetical protein